MKIEALSGFSESTMHHCWPMQPAGNKPNSGYSHLQDGLSSMNDGITDKLEISKNYLN
jgi:hypothetical protein